MKKYREKFEAYLKRRYGDRSTPKHYVNDVDMFIRQVGDLGAQEVKMKHIDEFIDEQQSRGLKPATLNRRLASIHTFFEFIAQENEAHDRPNPVQWKRHRVKEGSQLPRDASEQEVAALFEAVNDVRDKAMFGLMVGAGLRVGEVVKVQEQDLEHPASVEKSARLRVRGKGQKERIVWLTPKWYRLVANWISQRPASDALELFLSQHARALSVAGVQYRLRMVCKVAKIQITCHQLRHTFARRLAEQQMPTESIAQLMGHEQVSTTQRYTAGADLGLRTTFLQAMTQLEAQPQPPPAPLLPTSHGKRQVKSADQARLEAELTRFATLPEWLAPVLQRYLRLRWHQWQPHVARRLVVNLSSQLLRHWRWLVDERQIDGWASLKRADLEAWLAQRVADGIKANTIRTELSTLKACLREALAQELPVSAHLLRVKPPKKAQPLPRYLTPQQLQSLTNAMMSATNDSSFDATLARAWFFTLAHTGVRISELLNLRLSDVDFQRQQMIVVGGKNGNERIVYMTPVLSRALNDYWKLRPASDDDHLLLNIAASRLTAQQLSARLRAWGKQCDVPVTPHRLRHTFATQLVNQGMPLLSIAKLLGHQTLNMTQHYARLYEHTVKEQFEAATVHLDGILALNWPTSASTPSQRVEHMADSV